MEDNRPYKIPRPKGLAKYILENCAREGYLMFSKKLGLACCTRCGAEFGLDELPLLKHQTGRSLTTYCPECGRPVVPKDLRYGRKKLTDYGRIIWTKAYKGVTILEVDAFKISYQTPHPAVYYLPQEQIRLTSSGQQRWDYYEQFGAPPCWAQVKTIGLRAAPQIYGWSRWHDHIYWAGLQFGDDLRYASMSWWRFRDERFDESWTAARIIQYISDFLKYPAIEILEKSGFDCLVMNRASGQKTRNMNLRAKDLRKILKVDGGDVKKLREQDPTMSFLDAMVGVRKFAPWAQIEDVTELDRIIPHRVDTDRWKAMVVMVNISKLLKKILEYNRRAGHTFTLNDYMDYLDAVIALGMRLDKRALYPKDFVEAHDRTVAEAAEKKVSADAARFAEFQERITGMVEPFGNSELFIRPAKSAKELRQESQALNHCVRTYADRVAKGKCAILFIRRADAPEVPWFTLELSPQGEIVQCRGDHNCGYPDEVGAFIGEWMAWRKKERIGA